MRKILGFLAALLFAAPAWATCSAVPFVFSPGTTALSGQVNADLAALVACINAISGSQITSGTIQNARLDLATLLTALSGLPHKANNAALTATSSTAYTTVVRDGFAAPGDGGAATYTSSNVACTLNAGAGDNGSQVAAANGGCWLADLAPGVDIRQFGCVLDGVTSCDAALINAVAAAAGGTIVMPAPAKAAITGAAGTIALTKVKFDCRGPLNNTNSAAGQYGKQGGGFNITSTSVVPFTLDASVTFEGCSWYYPDQVAVGTAITVTASPFTYTNATGAANAVSVSGGTVSSIAINGVTQPPVTGTFNVPAGQAIVVTYSVAPTMGRWKPTVYPPLFEENPSTLQAINVVFRDNTFINTYELFRQTANNSSVGAWQIEGGGIYCIYKCFTFRNVPEVMHIDSHFTPGVFQNNALFGASGYMATWTGSNADIVTIEGLSNFTTQVTGLFFGPQNYYFGYKRFLHVNSGLLNLSSFDGGFDAIGQALRVENGGCITTSNFNMRVGYFYTYPIGGNSQADTVYDIQNPFANCHLGIGIDGQVQSAYGSFLDASGGSLHVDRIVVKSRDISYGLRNSGPYYLANINSPTINFQMNGTSATPGFNDSNHKGINLASVLLADVSNTYLNGIYDPIDASATTAAVTGSGNVITNTQSTLSIKGWNQYNGRFSPQSNWIDKPPHPTMGACGSSPALDPTSTDFDIVLTVGTGTVTSCVINMAGNYTAQPLYSPGGSTSGGAGYNAFSVTTTATVSSGTNMAGHVIVLHLGRP